MILLLLLVTILVLFLLVSWINLLRQSRRISLNGPMPWPVVGNAHMFVASPSEYLSLLKKLSLKYGDGFRVNFFSTPYVVLNHPSYVEQLMSSAEMITKGRSYGYLKCWLGEGLITTGGLKWRTHRKFLTPAFHFNMLQNFLPVFCKNQRILAKKLEELADGRDIDMFPVIALAALDNVTESIMGVSVNAQNNSKSEYVKAVHDASTILSMRMQIPFFGEDPIFNLTPYKTKLDKALKILHYQSRNVINTRRTELNNANITTVSGINDLGIRNKYAFLDLLLLAEADGAKISDECVREEVDTFMFAGHDTTTSGIVFTLFAFAKHKDVQDKVFDEQKRILGDDINRDPTFNEIHEMKYLEMAIREAMRVYPPVPLIERYITKDCEVDNMKLIKGTSVLINILEIQNHPDVFEDPLEFRPERFKEPLKNPFSWLAFSAGPRNCIGQKFAMLALKVYISAIIRQFIVEPSVHEPKLNATLVLRANNGVYIKLRPRKLTR